MKAVRVLVVEATPRLRWRLAAALGRDPRLEVVGTAGDAFEARDQIVYRAPDVMTLDLDLPRMDGLAFLRRLMPQHPLPVVVVSSTDRFGPETRTKALDAGAVAFLAKPAGDGIDDLVPHLRARLIESARVGFERPPAGRRAAGAPPSSVRTVGTLIALGASTGGIEALTTVLTALPAQVPAIVVVQHVPDAFTGSVAGRLNDQCAFPVRVARHGELVLPGTCLVAPGDQHLQIAKEDGQVKVALHRGVKVDGHRPSATVMMQSVARVMGPNASGALLTGMGRDGADGLLAMRRAGAYTVAQDEATSVVYGMPRAAWECGAARLKLPLEQVAASLLHPFRG